MCDAVIITFLLALGSIAIVFMAFLFHLIIQEYQDLLPKKKVTQNPVFEKVEPRL